MKLCESLWNIQKLSLYFTHSQEIYSKTDVQLRLFIQISAQTWLTNHANSLTKWFYGRFVFKKYKGNYFLNFFPELEKCPTLNMGRVFPCILFHVFVHISPYIFLIKCIHYVFWFCSTGSVWKIPQFYQRNSKILHLSKLLLKIAYHNDQRRVIYDEVIGTGKQ